MRILITNDDGINSPILPKLAKWASKFAEVTVVAPKAEHSGKSQAINFTSPVEIKKVPFEAEVQAYAVDSTPADCVRFAVMGLKTKYDLIISGVNRGYNLGDDIAYSGTIGAILEGARMGIRGLALSTDIDILMESERYFDMVYNWICERNLYDYALMYNVNIPHKVEGIRITKQGGVYYTDGFECRGDDKYIQVGEPLKRNFDNLELDIDAVENSLISVTPITVSKTDLLAFEKIKDIK